MKLSKEFKIGLLVVCAIAAFVWGINFLKGTNLFSYKYYLYAVYPRLENLKPTDALLIKGYKVGQINDISLIVKDGKHQVLVEFLLTEDITIPENSVARAISNDILGNKAVEIILGNSTQPADDRDTLVSEMEQGLKESFNRQIAPLQAQAEHLLANIDSVMSVVNTMLNAKTRRNIEQSFESVRRAILSLEQTANKLDRSIEPKLSALLTNMNQIASNLNRNEQKITNILTNFSTVSDSLASSRLKTAIQNAGTALQDLHVMLARINAGEGTLGKLARNDSLYNNLNKSAADLDKLLNDLNANPKRYVHFSIFGKKK